MRRVALFAALLLSPVVASAQATAGGDDDPTVMPDPEPEASAEVEAESEPADSAPVEARPIVHTEADIPRDREGTPMWESLWFWMAVSAVVLGITAAVVVDVTTDDPRPSPRPADGTSMGLTLRF